jgi:hypothetical protein
VFKNEIYDTHYLDKKMYEYIQYRKKHQYLITNGREFKVPPNIITYKNKTFKLKLNDDFDLKRNDIIFVIIKPPFPINTMCSTFRIKENVDSKTYIIDMVMKEKFTIEKELKKILRYLLNELKNQNINIPENWKRWAVENL